MHIEKKDSSKSIISSFIWKLLERVSTQIINLIIQIVLARMISPKEFGSLAILIVFINIANIFVQKGFSSSLIRKKEVDMLDYDTAFITSFLISTLLYIILFFMSPAISHIYSSNELKSGLRILSISLLFGALYCIQNAILVREMKFKIIFKRGLISSVLSGIIGIIMAIYGGGLWSLVVQNLLNQILLCLTVSKIIKWRPRFRFSFERLREIFSFGGKILISEIISYGMESIRTLSIGKKFSTEALSYYDRGQIYPATLMRSIYDTIGGVLLPVYSKHQDEADLLSSSMCKAISVSMFIITPFFVGAAAIAHPLINILLTEKWSPCIPYFMIFCFYQITYPIQGITRQILYARGSSDIVLKMEIIKGFITLISLSVSLQFNVFAVAIAALITTYSVTYINLIYTQKVIPIKILKIIEGMKKTILYNLIMFILIYSINFFDLSNILKLIVQVFVGISVYWILSLVFNDENYLVIKKLFLNWYIKK